MCGYRLLSMPRVAESIGLTSAVVYRQRATPIRETMSMTVRSKSSTAQHVTLQSSEALKLRHPPTRTTPRKVRLDLPLYQHPLPSRALQSKGSVFICIHGRIKKQFRGTRLTKP